MKITAYILRTQKENKQPAGMHDMTLLRVAACHHGVEYWKIRRSMPARQGSCARVTASKTLDMDPGQSSCAADLICNIRTRWSNSDGWKHARQGLDMFSNISAVSSAR